jgi:beta-galactosidase
MFLHAPSAPTVCLSAAPWQAHSAHAARRSTCSANGDHFELDGKPFQIISGAIHSARVPRAYWRDRLRKARAMGLNTVETYVFWNEHEPEPGKFDFSGQNDIAEFIREAQQEGLFVILRPGPYVCAEWEFRRLSGVAAARPQPWKCARPIPHSWLREPLAASAGPGACAAAKRNGGPIIAVQVENEYGSFGSDHQLHGADPSSAARLRLRQGHALHRRRRR